MYEDELEENLETLISNNENFKNILKSIHPFKVCGDLTNDNGFLLKTNDGSEFQITIIKTK